MPGRDVPTATSDQIASVFRREVGRCTATMIRVLNSVDLAEDAVAEAFAIAAEAWPKTGIPPNQGGWITTTARNRAIDRLRRESNREERHRAAQLIQDPEPTMHSDFGDIDVVPDDQLRLMFLCCHPALAPETQVALTLRLLGGLDTAEIARAFLVPEATIAQRIVRAKRKIRDNHFTYRIPSKAELPDGLPAVLTTIYLIYNEAHTATAGPVLVRVDLAHEALRLARVLFELLPDEPEVNGLLALLLLTDARRAARIDHDGNLIRLANQDRALWNRDQINEGHARVRACLRRNEPGPYQIQAAIAAVHADALTSEQTDWAQIVALYDQLSARQPNDVVWLNRAVALAELYGPQAGLDALDTVQLDRHHLFHATRGDLLEQLGHSAEAADAFAVALDLATNESEQRYLTHRINNIRP